MKKKSLMTKNKTFESNKKEQIWIKSLFIFNIYHTFYQQQKPAEESAGDDDKKGIYFITFMSKTSNVQKRFCFSDISVNLCNK